MPLQTTPALPVRCFVLILFFNGLLGTSATQAAPQIIGVSPGAVKPGEPIDLTITGSDLANPAALWTSFPAEFSLTPGIEGNGTQADRVVYRVKATDPNVLGVHAIRLVSPQGVSSMKLLMVDDLSSLAQQAGNTSPATAQALTLPIAVDGRVDNLSLNYYRFTTEAGQKLSIEILARRMGSALDPMIRLFKADGLELAYNDDSPGLLGDARLCHTFAEAGEYILEVRDIGFQGGANHLYRLRIGQLPCINVPYPLGVKRGQAVSLEFAGPDVEGVEPLALTVPTDPTLKWLTVGAKRGNGIGCGFATVSVGDAEEVLEVEPNNTPEQIQKVALTNFNGRLQEPGDVDRFTFTAKQGAKLTLAAVTRRQGSPADLVLRLFNAQGGKIGEADDTGKEDGILSATIPADGDYTLSVEDLHGRGGSAFAYRIAVTETKPTFSLEAVADDLNVPAGGVAMIQIVANRSGYNGPIAIRAEGLPEDVTLCPTVIANGQKGANVCLKSTPAAKAGTLHHLKLIGEATIEGQAVAIPADITLALKAETNQMPYPPANLLDSLALAVAPVAPFSLRTEPEEIVFGPDLSATFKVIATRQADYKEPITLAVSNINDDGKPAPSLPANVTAALNPIPQDQQEVTVTLTAAGNAPQDAFTLVLDGSLKKGNATITQPVSLSLKLQKAYTLSIEPVAVAIKPESTQKIKVNVERIPAFTSPVEVTFKNLPAGITAAKATIPADQMSVEVEITAAKDAKPASANNITAEGTAAQNGKNFAASSAAVTITIQ